MMKGGKFSFVLVFVLSLHATGLTFGQTKLKIGYIPVGGAMPLYIAVEKGYLTQAGIQFELQAFHGSGPMIAPLAANQMQIAPNGINVGLFNAIGRGMPIIAVASASVNIPKHSVENYMVRADLKDKIRRVSDLKGRKVAFNTKVATFAYSLGTALEKEGLSLKDIQIVTIGFPEMRIAFETKAIDVAAVVDPVATMIADQGFAVKWKKTFDFVKNPYMQTFAVQYNGDWAAKNATAATNFITAWLKAARYYFEAVELGKNREEIVDIAMKYTSSKQRWIFDRVDWTYANPNGYVDKESLQNQIDWYFANGYITKRLSVDQVVNNNYVEQALKQLGTYEVVHTHPLD